VVPSLYSNGAWIQEFTENSTLAQQRWNNVEATATRVVNKYIIEAFYPSLPGGVHATACGNATTDRQGRELVEGTRVLCPPGSFEQYSSTKCYPCPSGSFSSTAGATRCTLIDEGYEMMSKFPFSAMQLQNLSIPLFAMANKCAPPVMV